MTLRVHTPRILNNHARSALLFVCLASRHPQPPKCIIMLCDGTAWRHSSFLMSRLGIVRYVSTCVSYNVECRDTSGTDACADVFGTVGATKFAVSGAALQLAGSAPESSAPARQLSEAYLDTGLQYHATPRDASYAGRRFTRNAKRILCRSVAMIEGCEATSERHRSDGALGFPSPTVP